MVQKQHDIEYDSTGFDSTKNYITDSLSKVVPDWIACRAVAVHITTDQNTYEAGESVEITIKFENRLPIPIKIPTPRQRRWGWEVDGFLEASDEKRYLRSNPHTFPFRAGETKTFTITWDGYFRRCEDNELDISEVAETGDHTITAFIAVKNGGDRVEDSTQIRII